MSRFEVDSERVAQSSAQVKQSVGTVTSEVDRMMKNLLDLQNSWKGQAASSFQVVVSDWKGLQERVRQSLEEINLALDTAGQQYAEVEARNTQMFR